MRRPRYRGAEDIGSWQHVLSTVSWIALLVNVLIITYTDNTLRDEIILPILATGKLCGAGPPFTADDACTEAYRSCYAEIGGEAWLPAQDFLPTGAPTTRSYLDDGLCGPPGNPLYDQVHCVA